MKLRKYVSKLPVQFEGESSMATACFAVGGTAGNGTVESIEATPMGIVIRRIAAEGAPELLDVLLAPDGGYGFLADKVRREPQQLAAKGGR